MKIITISREFGSGGRELGKKIAAALDIAYYDSEIIKMIAEKTDLSEEYVNRVIERTPMHFYPMTPGGTFHPTFDPHFNLNNKIYAEQNNILREVAKKSDCVIVGRCADYILREFSPLRVFVYSEMEKKIERCRRYAPESEHLTYKQLRSKIRSVDKERARYYEFFTGQKWGKPENFDLCINTSNVSIDDWVTAMVSVTVAERNAQKKTD